MSGETLEHLNTLTLRGFRERWGRAWHYRAALQGEQDNHYDGPVPVGDVMRRLFSFNLRPRPVAVLLPVPVQEAIAIDEDGVPVGWVEQTDRKAVTRDDTNAVLSVFKDGYEIHQYTEWLIDSVADLIGTTRGDLGIESAGLLREGAQAWVQVGVPETVHTPQGVSFRPHLLGVTSCDGSIATGFKRCVQLVVCDNTRDVALREDGEYVKVRHSRWSGFRLLEARHALNLVETMTDDFATEVADLCATTVTDRQWEAFLAAHIPVSPDATRQGRASAERRRETLSGLWRNDERVAPWQNTAFGVAQAVNTYGHWERRVGASMSRADRNIANIIGGRTGRDDASALRTLTRILATAR